MNNDDIQSFTNLPVTTIIIIVFWKCTFRFCYFYLFISMAKKHCITIQRLQQRSIAVSTRAGIYIIILTDCTWPRWWRPWRDRRGSIASGCAGPRAREATGCRGPSTPRWPNSATSRARRPRRRRGPWVRVSHRREPDATTWFSRVSAGRGDPPGRDDGVGCGGVRRGHLARAPPRAAPPRRTWNVRATTETTAAGGCPTRRRRRRTTWTTTTDTATYRPVAAVDGGGVGGEVGVGVADRRLRHRRPRDDRGSSWPCGNAAPWTCDGRSAISCRSSSRTRTTGTCGPSRFDDWPNSIILYYVICIIIY